MDEARTAIQSEWQKLASQVGETLAARGQSYGDPSDRFRSIGWIWRGILENHFGSELPEEIPARIVSLMLAGMKLSRASRPRPHREDNFLDAIGYLYLGNSIAKNTEVKP